MLATSVSVMLSTTTTTTRSSDELAARTAEN